MTTFTTYATDTTTTGGRGTPNALSPGSDSNNWTQQRGDQTASFASNQLVLTYNLTSTLGVWTYSTQSQADQEVLVNVTQNAANSEVAGAVVRCSDSNHFYYADIGNSTGNVEIGKYVSGTFTSLAVAAFTSSFGTKYALRFQVIGSTLKARIWDASTTEPSAWSVQVTDTTLYTGGFGICMAPQGGSNCRFDTFSATNGVIVSTLPAAVGTELLGLVAAANNADLVPSIDISAYQQWSLQISALASGATISFQGSNDNTNFTAIFAAQAPGMVMSTTSTTGLFYGPRVMRYLRVRQTAWSSGSSTGTLELYYASSL